MSDGRTGTLVCACTADGKIVLHAPYDFEENRIVQARQKREGQKAGKEEKHEGMDTKRV